MLIIPFSTAVAAQQSDGIVWQRGTGDSTAAAPAVQVTPVTAVQYDPSEGQVPAALQRWKMLSASGNFSFAEYASFLMRYPDWPNSDEMRNKAEQAINPLSLSPSQVVAFFDRFPPLTNAGRARFAIALHASGDTSRAEVQAREAWRGGALNDDDEARMFRIAGNRLTSADHDVRVDRLLWSGSTRGAERWVAFTSQQRRPAFVAALAIRMKAPDTDQKVQEAGSLINSEASLIAARANFMRASGDSMGARELLANRANLAAPAPVLKDWYQLLLTHAQAAANDGQYDIAYRIASRVDDATPRGLIMVDQDLATRDRYTSLTWLAGMTAMERLGRPGDAIGMFERYASAAKSAQTRSKGLHFAGKRPPRQEIKRQPHAFMKKLPHIMKAFLASYRLNSCNVPCLQYRALPPKPPFWRKEIYRQCIWPRHSPPNMEVGRTKAISLEPLHEMPRIRMILPPPLAFPKNWVVPISR